MPSTEHCVVSWILFILSSYIPLAYALGVDFTSAASIKSAARLLAQDTLNYYSGHLPGFTPGNLPEPYYWWECGALFGSLIDYRHYTGDTHFDALVMQGMQHQVGPNLDFMPPNQTKTLGNDDQGFWALSAISAAEVNYPNPPEGQPQWLALAQAVFNTQAPRWEMSSCGGGLRWQIYTFNGGYTYKNSVSNGVFMDLGARLALYTGNATYAEWAEKTWDWMESVKLIDENGAVLDGCDELLDCREVNGVPWSYNAGVVLHTAASMHAYMLTLPNEPKRKVEEAKWKERIDRVLTMTIRTFFHHPSGPTSPGVMYEPACEPINSCNVDQQSFKAFLSRWLAWTSILAPWTAGQIRPLLRGSAVEAMKACTGGASGRECGLRWTENGFDGVVGVGQTMAALEVLQSALLPIADVKAAPSPAAPAGHPHPGDAAIPPINSADPTPKAPPSSADSSGFVDLPPPVRAGAGGTSKGDPSAGGNGWKKWKIVNYSTGITTKDKVGAGFVTVALCVSVVLGGWFMLSRGNGWEWKGKA
jgi:mannan endo-1,6-alpha-mannosidase